MDLRDYLRVDRVGGAKTSIGNGEWGMEGGIKEEEGIGGRRRGR